MMSYSSLAEKLAKPGDRGIRIPEDPDYSSADGFHLWVDFFEEQMTALESQLSTQMIDLECIQSEIDAIRSLGSSSNELAAINRRSDYGTYLDVRRGRCVADDGVVHDVLKQMHKNLAKKSSATSGLKLDLMRLKRHVLQNCKLGTGKSPPNTSIRNHNYVNSSNGNIMSRLAFSDDDRRYSLESDNLPNRLLEENKVLRFCVADIRAAVKKCLSEKVVRTEDQSSQENVEILRDSTCKDLESLVKCHRQLKTELEICRQSLTAQKECHDDFFGQFESENFNEISMPESGREDVLLPEESSLKETPKVRSKMRSAETIKSDESEDMDSHTLKNTAIKSELLFAQKQLEAFQTKIFEAIQLVYDVEMDMRSEQDLVAMVIAVAEECNALRQEVSYLRKMRQEMKESCKKVLEYVLDAEKTLEVNGRGVESLREVVSRIGDMVDSSECTAIEETFWYLYSNQLEWVEKLTNTLETTSGIPEDMGASKKVDPISSNKTISTQTTLDNTDYEQTSPKSGMCDKSIQLEDSHLDNMVASSYPFDGFSSEPISREIYVVHEEDVESRESDDDDDDDDISTAENLHVSETTFTGKYAHQLPKSIKFPTATKFKSFVSALHSMSDEQEEDISDGEDLLDQMPECCENVHLGQSLNQKTSKDMIDLSTIELKSPMEEHRSKRSKRALKEDSLVFPEFLQLSGNQFEINPLNDFTSTALQRFISSHLGFNEKDAVIYTSTDREEYKMLDVRSDKKQLCLIDNVLLDLEKSDQREQICPAYFNVNMDSRTALKLLKYFYCFEKDLNLYDSKGRDKKLTTLICKHFTKNKPKISHDIFEQYMMWLPHLMPLSLKMIQKFERVLGTETFTKIVEYSPNLYRSLPYKQCDTVFQLNLQDPTVKSLVLGESVFISDQLHGKDSFFNSESITAIFLAIVNESNEILETKYTLHKVKDNSVQEDLSKLESHVKVLNIYLEFGPTSSSLHPTFVNTYLLMEKRTSEIYFSLTESTSTLPVKNAQDETFMNCTPLIFILTLNYFSKNIPKERGSNEYFLSKIGEVHRTNISTHFKCHKSEGWSLLEAVAEIEVIENSILPTIRVYPYDSDIFDCQSLNEASSAESSCDNDDVVEGPVMADVNVEMETNSLSLTEDVVEEEVIPTEIYKELNLPSGAFNDPSINLTKISQQDFNLRETSLRDEIVALKENLDHQNAVLQKLKQCSDESGQELLLKDEKIAQLQNEIISLNQKLDEADSNKVNFVEDRLIQTESSEVDTSTVIEMEVENLREKKLEFLEKLSVQNEVAQKIKIDLQKTISHLIALKAAAGSQLQKQREQKLNVIQVKQQMQDAEEIISKLREEVEEKSQLLSIHLSQPVGAVDPCNTDCSEQNAPSEFNHKLDVFCQTDDSHVDETRVPNEMKIPCEALCDLLVELLKKLNSLEGVFSCKCLEGGFNNNLEATEEKWAPKNTENQHGHELDVLQLLATSDQAYHSVMDKISSTMALSQRRKSSLSSAIHSSLSEDATEASREQSPESSEQELTAHLGYFNVEQTKRVPDVLQNVEDPINLQGASKKKIPKRSLTARSRKSVDRYLYHQKKVPLELKNAKILGLGDDQELTKVQS